MKYRAAIAVLLSAAMSGYGHAADPRYPDWPCTQAKVPEISVAAVWAGPPLDDVGRIHRKSSFGFLARTNGLARVARTGRATGKGRETSNLPY
jgi:hypothetical protein